MALSLGAAVGVPVFLAWRSGLPLGALIDLPLAAHLAGGCVLAVEVAARAGRLVALARPLGVPLRWRTALLAQVAADAAGAVTPSRSGSEPAKLLSMRRDGGGLGGVAAVAVGEMAFETTLLLAVAVVLATGLGGDGRPAALAVLAYAGTVAAALSILLVLAGRGARGRPVPGWWRAMGLRPGRWRVLERTAREFRSRAAALRHLPARAVAGAAAGTLLHQAARAATFPALAWGATADPTLPWVDLTLWPFSLLYLGALLPPPGGGGGIEIGFAALLEGSLPPDQLPVLLLWWRVYTHVLSAVVGAACIAVVTARRRGPSPKARQQLRQFADR